MKGKWKRLLAAVLAASMIFGNAVPAYATESEPVIEVVEAETEVTEEDTVLEDGLDDTSIEIIEETVSETVEEAIEETVEEPTENVTENTAESETELNNVEEGELEEVLIQETVTGVSTVKTYNSSEYLHEVSTEYWRVYNRTDEDSHFLIVELKDAVKADIDWLIAGIDECKKFMANEVEKRGAGYTSLRIEIQYDSYTGSKTVPVSLWNAAAAYGVAAASQNFSTWFFFGNRNDIQYKWVFEDIQKITDGSTNVNMEMSVNIESDSTTLTMPDTSFCCSDAITLFCVYSTRTEAVYENFVEQYGTKDAEVEIWKEGSSEPQKNTASYDYEDGSAEVNLGWVSNYTKGNYILKKQEPVEEEDYIGTIIEGGKGLLIDCDKLSGVANFETAVEKILKDRAEDTTTKFRRIEINYPVITGSVSASVWNAAVALLDPLEPDEDTELFVNFYDDDRTNHNWRFVNPSKVSSTNAIDTGIDVEFYKDEIDGQEKVTEITLKFDKTNYAAEKAYIGFYTNNDRYYSTTDGPWNDFTDFTQFFGNSTSEVLLMNGSTQASTVGYYIVDNSGEPRGFWLEGFDANKLTSGVKYHVEKEKYSGSVQREQGRRVLYIRHSEADPFNDNVILDALQARIDAGESFDQVMVCYPNGYDTTVPEEIWNAVGTLMNNDEWSAGFLFDGGDYMDKNWYVAGMQSAEADVTLNSSMSDIGTGSALAKVTFTGTMGIPANDVHIRFCTSHWNNGTPEGTGEKLDYADVVDTFGTDNIQLELYNSENKLVKNTSARYEYYSDGPGNDNLDVCFDNINRYDDGTYTVVQKPYRGETGNWKDGTSWLNINVDEFENYGETFSEAAIIKILNDRKTNDESYDRVELHVPKSFDSITADAWNAAVALLNADFHDRGIQINYNGTEAGTGFWFNKPETTDKSVSLKGGLEFNKEIAEDEYRDMLEFENTDYPAEHVNWDYWADSNNESMQSTIDMLFEKFGNESKNVGLYDEIGNSPEGAGGHFNIERREDGSVHLNLGFNNLKNLQSQTMYGVFPLIYTGDESEQDNGQSRLTIDPWSAGRNGEIFTTRQLDEIFGNRDQKFNQIEFMIPWSESNTIYADWIEIANDFLIPNDNGNKFVIFTFVNREEGYSYQVWLTNPGITSANVAFKCNMYVDEASGKVKATVGKLALNAEQVFIQYHGTAECDGNFAQQLNNRFGGSWNRYYPMYDGSYKKVEATYSIHDGWNGYDRHFEIFNPDNFDDKTNYQFTFGLNEYSGEIRGEGTNEKELFIDMNDFGVYGLEATDSAIIDVIQKHADNNINWVVFDNYTSEFISKDVWNAVVGILNGEQQVIRIYNRYNEQGLDWWFENPEETSQDLSLKANYNFGEENSVSFVCTKDYPAINVACNYWTNNSDKEDTSVDETHNAMKAAFGTSYTGVAVLDENKDEVPGVESEYNVYTGEDDYLDLNVNIWNIKNLESNTEYTLEPKAYTGYCYEGNIEGVTSYGLSIDPWSAGKPEGFTVEEITEILTARKDEEFNHIEFMIPMSENNVIPAEFVNKALEILGDNFKADENGRRYLLFNFTDRESEITCVVFIVNPEQLTDDIPVQFDLSIDNENRVVVAAVNKMDFNGAEAFIEYYENPKEEGITRDIIDCFGEREDGLELISPTADHMTATYRYIRGIYFDRVLFKVNAGSTGFDQDYTEGNELRFEPKPYLGNTFTDDEGHYGLALKEYEANEAGFEFNDDTIIRALELRADEEERFDIVHIEYNHGECIDYVFEDVWNAAVQLLDENPENNRLEIHSGDDKGNGENWFFMQPYEAEYGIDLNNQVFIGGAGEFAQVRFNNNDYPAEYAQLSIWADYSTEGSNYEALVAAFGEDSVRFDLLDEYGNIWQDAGGDSYLNKGTDEEGNEQIHGFGFNVGNVNELWVNHTYTMCSYTGDDRDGCLYIDSWEAGKDGAAFTFGEIQKILKMRGDAEYEAIFVVQEAGEENKVDALIASVLAQRLVDWAETTLIRYDFRHADGSGTDIFYLINPDRQSPLNGENLVLDADFTWDAENNEAIINIKGMNVNAEGVAVAFNPYYGDDSEKTDADKIKSAYGGMPYENYELKWTGGTGNDNSETVKAYYQKQDNGVYLEIGYTEDIDKEKTYRISRAKYIGEVMDFIDNTEALLINAWHAGKNDEYLTDEEVAAIVAEHVKAYNKFASVELLQPYTSENTISAAAATELLKILQAPGEDNSLEETYLSFTFVELGGKTTTVRLVNPSENPLGESDSIILTADIFTQQVEVDEEEISKPMVSIDSIQLDAEDVIVGITELESDENSDYYTAWNYYGGAYGFTYNLVDESDENVNAAYMPNGDNVYIEVSDPNGFGRNYELERAEYFGNIHDLGDGREKLYINAWEAGYADGPLPEEELRRILNHYYVDEEYETVPGRYFEEIEIVQPYDEISNPVSRVAAYKAAELLNKEDNCLKFTYCYTDGSGAIVSLVLENPEETPIKTYNAKFKAELSFDAKGQPVVSIDPMALGAEKQTLCFDLSYDGYLAHELLWAFGGVNDRTYIVNTSDANATGTYIPREHGVYLEIEEPDGFNLGGTYTLTRQPYLGNAYYEGDTRWLSLYYWEMNEEGVDLTNETQVVKILNQWKAAGEKFDIVEIFYEGNPGAVSYKVWNAARTLLNSTTDGEIRLNVAGEIEDRWTFHGPKNASKKFSLYSYFDPSIDGNKQNPTIYFENLTFPAEEAYWGYYTDCENVEDIDDIDDDWEKERYQAVKLLELTLKPDKYYALYDNDVMDKSVLFYSNSGEYDGRRWVSGDIRVNELKTNTVYDIKSPEEYKGYTYTDEDGNVQLVISEFELEYYGDRYTTYNYDELINAILSKRADETFHKIYVEYMESPKSIPAATWNALIDKLVVGTETEIGVGGIEDEFMFSWNFKKPKKVEASTLVDISTGIEVEEEGIRVNYVKDRFPAADVEVAYYVNGDSPDVATMLNDSFAMDNAGFRKLSVIDSQNNLMPIEIGAQLTKFEDGDYREFRLYIENVELMKDSPYMLKPYLGHIDEWTDDDGTARTALNVHYGVAGLDRQFTEEELLDILKFHTDNEYTYDEVRIEQKYEEDNNLVYPSVANEAAALLKENGNQILTLSFWYDDVFYVNWNLTNPGDEPIGDSVKTLHADVTADVDKQMILAIADVYEVEDIAGVFDADCVDIEIFVKTELATGQYLAAVIEENDSELGFVEDSNIQVFGRVEEDRAVLTIHNIAGDNSVELGKNYTLGDAEVYYGSANLDTKFLYLDSEVIGKNAFTAADIQGIVDYYKGHQLVFDQIMVSQKSALSNTIKKELINSLREILNWEAVAEDSNYEVSIRFIFCNCEDNEDGLTVQNDQGWMLINPGVATADINANVTLTSSNANGVSVKLNKNTYNAKEVRVDYSGHAASPNGEKITAGIGEIVGNNEVRLVALTKGTEVAKNVQSTYNIYELSDGEGKGSRLYVDFVVDSAQNLTPGTAYTFEQYTEELGTLYVGDEFELSSDATWRLLNSDTASISLKDGKQILVPFNEGSVYVMKTYKEDGITKTEIQKGTIEVDVIGIVLDREGTVELEVGDYESVSVSAYPSVAGHLLNADAIEWDYEEDILSLDEQEGCFATFIAIGEGTTTVKASYGGLTDSFEITVRNALEYNVPEDVYALTNFDTKLSDIELPEGWAWKTPKTSLSAYKDLESYKFTAVYTETLIDDEIQSGLEARTVEADIEVAMLKLERIEIIPLDYDEPYWSETVDTMIPTILEAGQEIVMDYMFVLSRGGNIVANADPLRMKVRADYFGMDNPYTEEIEANTQQLQMKWTLPKNTVIATEGEGYTPDTIGFTADSANSGKKTFTASLVNEKNKVLFKDSITVTVPKEHIADIEFIKEYSEYDSEQDVYIFRQPMDNYYNLKFATSDTTVLKKMTVVSAKERYYNLLGETVWETRVQCTEGNPGFANITVTTDDELKSKIVFGFKVIDEMPKVMESAFELNKAFEGYYVPITIQFPDDAMPSGDPYIGVEEQYQDIFDVQYDADYNVDRVFDEDDNSYVRRVNARLVFNDKEAAKAKTYKNVILEVDTANDIKEVKINVKVIDKAPKVTIKQTKNINAFYKDMEGYEENLRNGLLSVSAPGLNVAYVDVYSEGFYTKEIEPGLYELCTENSNITKGTYTNVYVGYEVYNEQGAWYWNEAKLTVKVDEKAPSLVLSAKSDTLYPNYSAKESSVGLFDKSTGKMLELSQVTFVENRKKGLLTPIYGEETDITFAKNIFAVRADIEEDGWIDFRLQDGEWKNGTAKFTFDVKEESWNKPVSVSYSIKVNTAKPTLKLGSSKLTLNMNPEIAEYQRTTTTLTLNGFNNLDSVGGREVINENNVRFVGNDANATALLNNVITLKYDDYTEGIVAELHPNAGNFKTGNYKYKVFVTNEDTGFEASTTITVSIVNTTIAKSVKISKKGSIDVLRRDTTYIAYTPKFSNIAGKMSAVRLEGTDKDMFDVRLSEDESAIEIFAKDDKAYSTKVSYSVIPVVTMAYAISEMDMVEYPVALPAQTIKVTQGKPKATITAPNGNVLYTQHGGDLTLDLAAILGGENIEVENVSLANYTSDLKVEGCWTNESNGTTIYLRASDNGFNQINKTGKTWSLKFEVTYADKAVDQKPVTVTYKVTVK